MLISTNFMASNSRCSSCAIFMVLPAASTHRGASAIMQIIALSHVARTRKTPAKDTVEICHMFGQNLGSWDILGLDFALRLSFFLNVSFQSPENVPENVPPSSRICSPSCCRISSNEPLHHHLWGIRHGTQMTQKKHKNGKSMEKHEVVLTLGWFYESEPDLCFFWNGRVSAQANNDWATHQTNKILVLPQSPTINQVHFLPEHEYPKTSWARKKIPSFPMKRWLRMGYPAGWVNSTLYPTENHTL
jgi:hypothetical protein